jgi:hypothetical protein
MSLDYSLFLRDEPALTPLVAKHKLERKARDFVLGGMRVWIDRYAPSDDDALADHP